jgi:hypothetical protein
LDINKKYIPFSLRLEREFHEKLSDFANSQRPKKSMGLIINEVLEDFLN